MNVKKLALYALCLTVLVLGACGSKDNEKEKAKPAATEEKTDKTDQAAKADEDKETDKKENSSSEQEDDGAMLNPYLEEETGGDIEVVFTNKNPGLKHSYSDDVTMEIDEYQIVHVSNMNESAKVNFDDEEEGYVLTYKLTLDNQSDQEVNFAGGVSLLSDDGMEHLYKKQHLVDREEWLKDESTEDASLYSKGKSFTGMIAHTMTKAQFEKLSSPTLTIDALWVNNDTSTRLGEDAVFKLPVNEEGTKKAETSAGLYQDKMVTDTIADKELFFEKEGMNETKEIEGVKVTLNGVQYANVTPTPAHKERFKNFGDGPLVALTAKFTIENGSETPFDKFLIEKKLHIDGDRGTMSSQGMLEPTVRGTVEPGDKEEMLAVFLFREDEFGIFKKFELQIGPLSDENAKRLFKEKHVTFDLPVKK